MYIYAGASSLAWIAVALAVLWAGPVLSSVPLVATALQLLGLVMAVQLAVDAYRGSLTWPGSAPPDGNQTRSWFT